MRNRFWIALVLLAVLLPATVEAQPPRGRGGAGAGSGGGFRGPPAFMTELYPPNVIMQNQSELDLTDDQKSAIMSAMRKTRDALDPVQWELQEKQQKLAAIVAATTIDEAAVLAQAEEVMNLEKELKKQHLLLLVTIKNALTPEQQEKAKSLRSSGRRGGFPGPGGRPRGGGMPGGRP